MNLFQKYRVKTPTVLQMEMVECGAASLSMILSYYDKHIPLSQLRVDCGVTRDGSKASNILKAAQKYGFDASGFKIEMDEIDEIDFPSIVFWNLNHFLVLEGFKKDKFYLNDPAVGHRVVSYNEFNRSFSGIVLSFEPNEEFEPSGTKTSIVKNITQKLAGYGKTLVFLAILGLFLVIPGLVIPAFTKMFVDDILIGGEMDWFVPLILGMIFTAVLKGILEFTKFKILLKARSKLDMINSANYIWHVLSLPIQFFTQRHSGEIGNRVFVNEKFSNLLTGKLANNMLDIIMLIFFFIVMLHYDVVLTIMGVGLSLFNIIMLKVISDKRAEGYLNYTMEEGKLMGVSMSGLKIIETLKAMGRENDFFAKWAGYFTKVLNAEQKLSGLTVLLNLFPILISSLITITILIIGTLRVMDGLLTMGALVALQGLIMSFNQPIENLVHMGSELQEVKGDITRLDDVLGNKKDSQLLSNLKIHDGDYSKVAKKLEGNIELKNVTFGYSVMQPPLIEKFNLKLSPGKMIALVGGSGSGKSTIAKLLAGFYEPWDGKILFDGKPRNEWPRQIINNTLAMVSQDFFFIEDSVREVITLWDKTIPNQSIIQATKDACIHDIISEKINGYDYVITEGGKNFSGGQCQRIEISRALVGNPNSIILDEATSALDPTTEKIVMNNIKKRKCSILIVAHRLSTIRDSDEIIVMSNGKIVERGTHEELMKLKSEYWSLIKS